MEGLRSSGHGVLSRCRRAILRGAHEFDSATLDDDVGGWWKILRVTDRVAVAQKTGFLPVQGMDLPATEGKNSLENAVSTADGAFYRRTNELLTTPLIIIIFNIFSCI